MSISRKHLLSQGPVVAALLRAVTARKPGPDAEKLSVPTPVIRQTVPPRSPDLVRDYIRAVGGSTGWYRGVVPPHLFPQWGFPLLSRTLDGIPYDLVRILNAGCSLTINRPIPLGEPLHLEAFLEDIDDDGSRAILHERLVTSTPSAPEALVARVQAVVPVKRPEGAEKQSKRKKDKPRVPEEAFEVARFRLTPQTARDFAVVTGDINPVHWLQPYARAAGFRSTILHGFATLAHAIEGLNRGRLSGDPTRLASISVRFTRPLLLPSTVGLYLDGAGGLAIGDAPGGPAYLKGTFEIREEDES